MNSSKAMFAVFAAQLVLAAAPPNAGQINAPPPRLLREIDLNRIIGQPAGLLPAARSVTALACSPDENWIAVAVGLHRRKGKLKTGESVFESNLLILPLKSPPDHPIELDAGVPLTEGSLVWSPNSDALVGQDRFAPDASLYSVRGQGLWKRDQTYQHPLLGPWIVGFLDPGHLLAQHITAKEKLDGFDTLDLQGQVVDTWPSPGKWTPAAISSDRHLLAVFSGDVRSKLLIVEYPSKKVLESKSNPTWLYRDGGRSASASWYFADTGNAVCAVGSAEIHDPHAQCWDVDSGQKIAEYERFPAGAPAAASSHASRVVLTQGWFLPSRHDRERLSGGRLVWDFRSGAEVAAWAPMTQPVVIHGEVQRFAQPAPVAISATGRYVIEGADGILRVYELP
jgi:hypothetical protein